MEAYIGRFIPPSLTSKRRKEIRVFNQGEDESLYTEEARNLIEDLAICNMKNPSESSGSNNRAKGSMIIELNKMTAMEAKLDAIMHQMD